MTRPIKPEIMSPAGYWPQLEAAIEAGADAVYFGLKHFTARAKVGFAPTELPAVMRTLHQRGVRGFVTFNTLIFDNELAEAAQSLAFIAEAGADALIVQDLGAARLAHQIVPDIEIHGSTQMSITSAEGVQFAQRYGVSRVVLARELSLADVQMIRAQTACELEVFVHGALCVSYSGQCFSSEAWGGRSANRGQCAQACRLPYDLFVDGRHHPLADARYLLSPGDLYALQQVPAMVQLGIAAFKIEGRYKQANYVALTTRAYRQAVDEAWAGLPLSITPLEELQLAQVYSRGLGAHFVTGTNHQQVVEGRSPRHRGVLMGHVVRLVGERVTIAPNDKTAAAAPLKPGDGVVFDAADWRSPEEPEEGGRLYHVTPLRNGLLELEFAYGSLDLARIRSGDLVWRSSDPDLERVVRPYLEPAAPLRRQSLRVQVVAHAGSPLRLVWSLVDHPNLQVTVVADAPLGPAQNRALSAEFLREQLGRLGTTPYVLADLQLDMQGQPFAPSSLLNSLRRQATDQLRDLQGRPRPLIIHDPLATLAHALASVTSDAQEATSDSLPSARQAVAADAPPAHQLHLLVRTPAQLEAAIAQHPASITLDYLELYGLRPAVEQVVAAGIAVRVASPRVLKPDEQRVVGFLRKLGCPILVRSTGLLHTLQSAPHPELIGDFSLNAANVLTADLFLQLGLVRITPTYDLNAQQIATLAQRIGATRIEAVAFQHLPVFHTEHCVFCRFLSTGTSHLDCGHPCEQQRIALRDPSGRLHPVIADVGCRNTVFGAEAQEASRHLATWRKAGICHYRLEFVHETGEQVAQITRVFQAYFAGTIHSTELTRSLQQATPQGVTEGSLYIS